MKKMPKSLAKFAKWQKGAVRRRLTVFLALLAILQPMFGGLAQSLAKAEPSADGIFSFIQICTPSGVRLVSFDKLNDGEFSQEQNEEQGQGEAASAFCPFCFTVCAFAILDGRTAEPVSYGPITLARFSVLTALSPSQISFARAYARAPPFPA